ncbi:hypothetical protein KM043_006046 [Ampulex compressa]|nr:hypothetical protein KM043_006046 [Ampulex compressa]
MFYKRLGVAGKPCALKYALNRSKEGRRQQRGRNETSLLLVALARPLPIGSSGKGTRQKQWGQNIVPPVVAQSAADVQMVAEVADAEGYSNANSLYSHKW